MLAAPTTSGVAWSTLVAALVFLAVLLALAVDRVRLRRRLTQVERSEATLETDLADARRELDALRGVLRQATEQAPSGAHGDRPSGGPPTPVL